MAVLIKGMEMPRKCIRCPVNVYGRCLVNDDKDVSKATADAVRDKDCPLVPVPPHGRLIDVDKVLDELAHNLGIRSLDYLTPSERAIVSWFRDAPTIIPADSDEERREYDAQVEAAKYCEMYEPTYDPETGAM